VSFMASTWSQAKIQVRSHGDEQPVAPLWDSQNQHRYPIEISTEMSDLTR
jgi:hypothetical protein